MKLIKKILKYSLITILILFFLLVFLMGTVDCNWYMSGPCPEGWDPINECIEGVDCPD